MLAVLEDAIACFQKPSVNRKFKYRQEAKEWFLSEDSESPFSFVNVCDALGIDAKSIRREVLG